MIYVEEIEGEQGDLLDLKFYCSGFCYTEATGKSSYGHASYPTETDYDVYCASCDKLLWKGILPEDA